MSLPAKLLAVLLAALTLCGLSYRLGGQHAADRIEAAQARATDEARANLRVAELRADSGAAAYVQNNLDRGQRYDLLDRRDRQLAPRVGLLAPAAPSIAACAPAQAQTQAVDAQRAPPAELAGPGVGPADPELSWRAVWVWNYALAVTPRDVPEGACGLDGGAAGADAACAQGSGIRLEDAWANHRANARTCAEDRDRYRALIRELRGLGYGGAQPQPGLRP